MTLPATRWAAVAATTTLVICGGLGPAAAVSTDARVGPLEEVSAGRALDVNGYKAGYTAEPPARAPLRTARATFVVPEVSCKARHEGVAIGIGSEPSSGAPRYLAHVDLHCLNGNPFYELNAYVNDHSTEGPATAGDKVRVAIRHIDHGKVIVKTSDLTTGVSVRRTAVPEGAERGEVDFGSFPLYSRGMDPVPRFTSVRLHHAQINDDGDSRVCIATTSPEKNTRAEFDTGEVEISASDFTRCAFRLRWESH